MKSLIQELDEALATIARLRKAATGDVETITDLREQLERVTAERDDAVRQKSSLESEWGEEKSQMADIMEEIGAHPARHNTGEKAMMEVKNIFQSLKIERDKARAERDAARAACAVKDEALRNELLGNRLSLKAIESAISSDGQPILATLAAYRAKLEEVAELDTGEQQSIASECCDLLKNESAGQPILDELTRLRAGYSTYHNYYSNLLARIFRDGGHRQSAIGNDEEALAKADEEVANLLSAFDEAASLRAQVADLTQSANDETHKLEVKIGELLRENGELRKDRERLDWLEDNRERVYPFGDKWTATTGGERRCHDALTLRAAIDSALAPKEGSAE